VSVPINQQQITSEWLTDRLSSAGDCTINTLEFSEMSGHNPELSQLFRVRIIYGRRTPGNPDTVVVKIPPADDATRLREASYGPYFGELGAYRLLKDYQGKFLPRLFGFEANEFEQTAAFVFEDIGSLPDTQKYAPVDRGVAEKTLEFMASHHGRFWEDESLANFPWLRDNRWAHLFNQNPDDAAIGWKVIKREDEFVKTGGLVVAGEFLGPKLQELMDAMESRPNTLTHNDFHQGNVMLRSDGSPVIIDWQLPAYAGGTNDLAKFMMTAVPLEILEHHELELIRHYWNSLTGTGVDGYSFDECVRDYRRAQVMIFGNYSIASFEMNEDGTLAHSSGDSTRAVIRALTLVDSAEMREVLP